MPHTNIEIKAKTDGQEKIRELLKSCGARFAGIDQQIDTYFKVDAGRLKLREGNIENSLIHYYRENAAGPKKSIVNIYKTAPGSNLKEILSAALGIACVVNKRREIYFIGNVKFHLDDVGGLGSFVEIEAIDEDGSIGNEKLLEQCHRYLDLFRIRDKDLISVSYSDLLMS